MPQITYNLAPNPVWQFTDFAALYLKNGYMQTFRDTARTEPKPVYHDPEGTIPWENPLRLSDPDGSVYPIYWASDENYYVIIYPEDGSPDEPLYVFTNFNAPGFVNPNPDAPAVNKNFIIDGQFRFPTALSFPNIQRGTWFAPQWLFSKPSPSVSVDSLEIVTFPQGQTLVPGNPVNYINLNCTVPTSDNEKLITHYLGDVNTFENNTITISFYARSSTNSQISVTGRQAFGTGGSPSPDFIFSAGAFTLTSSWALYTVSVDVPSTSGKTIGTNGDDSLEIDFNFPLASVFNFNGTNFQIVLGSVNYPFDYKNYNLDRASAYGQKLPVPAYGNPSPDIGKYLTLGTESGRGGQLPQPAFVLTTLPPVQLYTGMLTTTILQPGQGPWDGWSIANGSPISAYENNMEGYNLYSLLSESMGGFSSDIFYAAGDGFTTTLVDSSTNVVVTNVTQGDAVDAADFNTGMVITTTADGSIGVSQVTKIFALPESSLFAGAYFTINGVSHEFCCYLTIDGEGDDPELEGHISIPIPLSSGMTVSQVAAVIAFQVAGAFYAVDLTGYFPRFGPTNTSAIRDPDYGSRSGGNVIGSTQSFALQTHTHSYNAPTNNVGQGGGDTAFAGTAVTPTSAPNGATLSTETRPINVYLLPLIKL